LSKPIIRQFLFVAGVVGVVGFLRQHPQIMMVATTLAMILTPMAYVTRKSWWEPWMSLHLRLAVEGTLLAVLLDFSSLVWTPDFYSSQGGRCGELARRASTVVVAGPEARIAIDRESAWFARKASELRWRGLRLGLKQWPHIRSVREEFVGRDDEYQLGVIESIDKHERSLRRWIPPGLRASPIGSP